MPSYQVMLGQRKQPYQIIQLSDLHIGIFIGARYIEKVVQKINAAAPDMVVITGDIFNNGAMDECASLDRIQAALRGIHSKDGVFAVLGNHDPSATDSEVAAFFSGANIHLLRDETFETPLFTLIGRKDVLRSSDRTDMARLSSLAPSAQPIVVLDHNPSGIREAAMNGADLVLCGHTHKGQMIPFPFFTRLFHDDGCFYGHSLFGKTQAIISAGTGYFQLPVRIGTNSEIVQIYAEF